MREAQQNPGIPAVMTVWGFSEREKKPEPESRARDRSGTKNLRVFCWSG
jgi:hypothetical protein